MNLPGFSIPPMVWIGLTVAAMGAAVLFILVKAVGGRTMMRVPDGVPPDQFYRDWKAGAFSKKITRGMVFVGLAALAMLIGGCAGIIAGIAL